MKRLILLVIGLCLIVSPVAAAPVAQSTHGNWVQKAREALIDFLRVHAGDDQVGPEINPNGKTSPRPASESAGEGQRGPEINPNG